MEKRDNEELHQRSHRIPTKNLLIILIKFPPSKNNTPMGEQPVLMVFLFSWFFLNHGYLFTIFSSNSLVDKFAAIKFELYLANLWGNRWSGSQVFYIRNAILSFIKLTQNHRLPSRETRFFCSKTNEVTFYRMLDQCAL